MALLTILAEGYPRRDGRPGWLLSWVPSPPSPPPSYDLPATLVLSRQFPAEIIAGREVTLTIFARNGASPPLDDPARVQQAVTDAAGRAQWLIPFTPPRGDFEGTVSLVGRLADDLRVQRPATFRVSFVAPSPADGGGGAGAVLLTWHQAEALARGGTPIRPAVWKDRYLVYLAGLWWLQRFDAITKALGAVAVVQADEWAEINFRERDWVAHTAVDAAALAAALAIPTVFPP